MKISNLQIGDNDIVGNKFNGHDLHLYLNETGMSSSHLVWNMDSNDDKTFQIAGEMEDRNVVRNSILDLQKRLSLNGIGNPLTYSLLYNKLYLDADVVHLHLIHNYIFDMQLLPIMSRLKPIVWTLHDPWSFGGHCIHHYGCDRWRIGCGDCPSLSIPFTIAKDNTALNYEIKEDAIIRSDFDIIVASRWMLNKVKESPMYEGKRVHLVPFGINQKIFKPKNKLSVRKKLGIPDDAIALCFRCDYSGFKGMDYIDYVLKNLKPNRKLFLLILANKYEGITNGIPFENFGWVKDDELLSDIYNASDLFLMPSVVESFGMMAAEAMSCGVTPIVLEGTALPDTVNSPNCGVAVEKDILKYKNIVQYYIDNADERQIRSQKCLEYAKRNFDKNRYVKEVVEIYKSAIEKHVMSDRDMYLVEQLKKNMCIEPTREKLGLTVPSSYEKVVQNEAVVGKWYFKFWSKVNNPIRFIAKKLFSPRVRGKIMTGVKRFL